MFLKSATSLLKIEGWRIKFLDRLPISPAAPGLPKQSGLITYANPVASFEPVFLFGSQRSTGRAFMSPPVKSVMVVDVHVVVDPGVRTNPAAQLCPVAIVYEAPLKLQFKPVLLPNVLGLPVAYDVVPEICQLSSRSLARRLFHLRPRPGKS